MNPVLTELISVSSSPPLPLSVCTPGPAETSSTPCLRSRPSTGPVCLVSRPLSCPHLHYSLSSSLPPSGPPYSMYPFLSSIVYLFILQDFFCLVLSKIAFTPFFPSRPHVRSLLHPSIFPSPFTGTSAIVLFFFCTLPWSFSIPYFDCAFVVQDKTVGFKVQINYCTTVM